MFDCKTIRQMGGVLGLVALFAASSSLADAPGCRAVFTREIISEAAITAAIKDIAKMRYELETANAQGTSGQFLLLSKMRAIFKSKYADLIFQLDGQKTESEIKDLIKNEILDIQGVKFEARNAEQAQKKQLESRLVFYPEKFELGNTVKLDFMPGHRIFQVIPKTTKFVMQEEVSRDLLIVDISTNNVETLLADAGKTLFTPDKSKLYSVTREGDIFLYDLSEKTKNTIKLSKKMDPERIYSMGLDPSGQQLVIGVSDPVIHLVDLATGKVSQRKIPFKDTPETSINSVDFLNSNTLVVMSSDKEAVLHDITTKKSQRLRIKNNYWQFYFMNVVAADKQVIFRGDGVVAKISVEDLLAGKLANLQLSTFYVGIVHHGEMAYNNSGLFAGSGKQYGLYKLGKVGQLDLKAKIYRDKEKMETIFKVSFDAQTGTAYFLYHKNGKYKIDVYVSGDE